MASAEQHHLTGKGRAAIEAFLHGQEADQMPHPGGTLLAHLGRVQGLLADWGADAVVQTAGLCHATYGTDGFAPALLPLSDRATLVTLIGEQAESLVYLYMRLRPRRCLPSRRRHHGVRLPGPLHGPRTQSTRRPVAGVLRHHGRQRTGRTGTQHGTGRALRPSPARAPHPRGHPALPRRPRGRVPATGLTSDQLSSPQHPLPARLLSPSNSHHTVLRSAPCSTPQRCASASRRAIPLPCSSVAVARSSNGNARGSGSVTSTRVRPSPVSRTRTVTGVPSPTCSITFVTSSVAQRRTS